MEANVEKNCDCKDRAQCWEPCGDLGKSEAHAKVVAADCVWFCEACGQSDKSKQCLGCRKP